MSTLGMVSRFMLAAGAGVSFGSWMNSHHAGWFVFFVLIFVTAVVNEFKNEK